MSIHYYEVIKRNGKSERFDVIKIVEAIKKAANATNIDIDYQKIRSITNEIEKQIQIKSLSVEEIQDIVEIGLMHEYASVAKAYILYRDMRNRERQMEKKD